MSSQRLLGIAIVLSVVSLSPAIAGETADEPGQSPATTGSDAMPGSDGESAVATSGLFDAVGLPLLRTSAPLYLQLQERPKLRDLSQGDVGGGGSYGGGGGGTASGGSGSSSSGDAALDGGLSAIGNVGFEYAQGTADPLAFTPTSIPEPALLLLLAPAVAFAIRRHARQPHAKG